MINLAQSSRIIIFIRGLTGKMTANNMSIYDTIQDLKISHMQKDGIGAGQVHLIRSGHTASLLSNQMTIQECGIRNRQIIDLLLRYKAYPRRQPMQTHDTQ